METTSRRCTTMNEKVNKLLISINRLIYDSGYHQRLLELHKRGSRYCLFDNTHKEIYNSENLEKICDFLETYENFIRDCN